MPFFTEFIPATQLHVCINASVLQQDKHGIAIEEGSASKIEASVARKQRGSFSVQLKSLLVHDKHGYGSAVLGIEPNLLNFVLVGIHIRLHPLEFTDLAIQRDAVGGWRHGIRMKRKKAFLAVPVAPQLIDNAAERGHGNISDVLAFQIVDCE